MKRPAVAICGAFILAALACPSGARADQTGSVELSSEVSGFSSSAYGPWVEHDLQVRLPPDGSAGIELIDRNARDAFNPSHAQSAALDYARKWSRRFSSYVRGRIGSAPPFPTRHFNFEGSQLVGKALVVSVGAGIGSITGIGLTRSLTFAVTYYHGDGYALLRFDPAWSRTLGYTQGYRATFAFGHPQQTTETLYLGTATESDISLQNPLNPSILGERESGAALVIKHWLRPRSGIRLGLVTGTLARADGRGIYARRAISFGAFVAL